MFLVVADCRTIWMLRILLISILRTFSSFNGLQHVCVQKCSYEQNISEYIFTQGDEERDMYCRSEQETLQMRLSGTKGCQSLTSWQDHVGRPRANYSSQLRSEWTGLEAFFSFLNKVQSGYSIPPLSLIGMDPSLRYERFAAVLPLRIWRRSSKPSANRKSTSVFIHHKYLSQIDTQTFSWPLIWKAVFLILRFHFLWLLIFLYVVFLTHTYLQITGWCYIP